MELFATTHPFIVLSMSTAIMAILFHAFGFQLGFTLSYVMLANPAGILHQVFMLDYLYTDEELSTLGIADVDLFAWESWVIITLTFATFSLVSSFVRSSMRAS